MTNPIIERHKRLVLTAEERKYRAEQSRIKREAEKAAAWKKHLEEYDPCPFCGSVNVYWVDNGANGKDPCDWVLCEDCGATGPQSVGREDAIDKWNNGIKE